MIRRWMERISNDALRAIIDEPVMRPGQFVHADNSRCIVGAACGNSQDGDIKRYVPVTFHEKWGPRRETNLFLLLGEEVVGYPRITVRFDNLCARYGRVRISRLCQESAIRVLVKRQPVEVPVQAEVG